MMHENGFNHWPFTSSQCIEKLALTHTDNPSLSYNLEWVALSVETFAVEQSKGVSLLESSELLSGVAASLDSVPNRHLIDIMVSNPLIGDTICDVLRIALCLPFSMENLERVNRLYALLPKQPTPRLFDVYIMYQVTFGFTNQLDDWNDHFSGFQKMCAWDAFNRLQLDYALALVSRSEENMNKLRPALINYFETYTETEVLLNSNKKIPTARSRLNWLLIYGSV